MNIYQSIGRVFLGSCLIGIGILHFFYPGIRPIIFPNLANISHALYWTVYLTGILLIAAGLFICINKKTTPLSLILGAVFFLLFAFGHLPAFLSVHGLEKLKYWVNMNKVLAFSGGFFILAAVNEKTKEKTKTSSSFRAILVIGKIFFALMLLLFGIGHLTNTASLSAMVPTYIPFAKFWTFLGGIILVGAAVCIVSTFQLKKAAFVLAVTLFTWLITLHLYYTIQSPAWQEGENFIGALSCMAFCGSAILVSQSQ